MDIKLLKEKPHILYEQIKVICKKKKKKKNDDGLEYQLSTVKRFNNNRDMQIGSYMKRMKMYENHIKERLACKIKKKHSRYKRENYTEHNRTNKCLGIKEVNGINYGINKIRIRKWFFGEKESYLEQNWIERIKGFSN